MATHKQYYLTCNGCGNSFEGSDGEKYGETSDEIKGIAVDEGWICDVKMPGRGFSYGDFCPTCQESGKVPL